MFRFWARVAAWGAPAGDAPVLWQAVRELRAAGERVVQATAHDDADQLHSSGCDRRLIEQQGAWVVVPLNS